VRWDFSHDVRGSFARIFCEMEFREAGLPFRVVQANVSRNPMRHTLRGLHLQREPHGEPKLVSCTQGRIWDVAVDMRKESLTYLRWLAFELGPDSGFALHLAEGIAHGFITLEQESEVLYLMGTRFVPGAAIGVRWDDPLIGIDWPAEPVVISDRDRALPYMKARS
jgi:dTDP-4-dehydrorhamnose 3,5-epimerase